MAISPVTSEVSPLTRAAKTVLSWVGIRDAEQKMRENASNWLELAEKVWHFRRDRLTTAEAADLTARTDELRQRLRAREDAAKLKLGIESLEAVLRRTGGAIYPKSGLVENVEFFLVAAIVILGVRTYFVQPFKIPTNSMWPTYYGMKGENFPPGTNPPGGLTRAFRLAAFGAMRKEAIAPVSGEVSILISERGVPAAIRKPGRTWLVLPTTVSEYTFYVGETPTTISLPVDFHDFDELLAETYFGSQAAYFTELDRLGRAKKLTQNQDERASHVVRMPLGKSVNAGDPLIRFDLLTGDQLFVDRLSYHFIRPKVGQGFVFRTDNIHSEFMTDEYGRQLESYYIKRLVGLPGDTLEVKSPVLYRNGQPISGASAFEANAQRQGKYTGYVNAYRLSEGEKITVPKKGYFAMGDNSSNSQDSRYWGFVPAKDVAGRPLFIYYPFTSRWGPAR